MEEKLLETLKGYCNAARELSLTEAVENFDDEIPDEVQWALVRMAAAVSLAEQLEKSEAFLSEESPEEITEAYFEAQEEISHVLDDSFASVDSFIADSPELQERVENLSVSMESQGLADDLLKLYKCEGIIRMAYRSAQKYTIYGAPDRLIRMEENEEEVVTDQEVYLKNKLGVDINALLEIREKLIADAQQKMKMTQV